MLSPHHLIRASGQMVLFSYNEDLECKFPIKRHKPGKMFVGI